MSEFAGLLKSRNLFIGCSEDFTFFKFEKKKAMTRLDFTFKVNKKEKEKMKRGKLKRQGLLLLLLLTISN